MGRFELPADTFEGFFGSQTGGIILVKYEGPENLGGCLIFSNGWEAGAQQIGGDSGRD